MIPKEQLIPILQFHIADRNYRSSGLNYVTISTLNGDIAVDLSSSLKKNSSAYVSEIDLRSKNGGIHSINKALISGK